MSTIYKVTKAFLVNYYCMKYNDCYYRFHRNSYFFLHFDPQYHLLPIRKTGISNQILQKINSYRHGSY